MVDFCTLMRMKKLHSHVIVWVIPQKHYWEAYTRNSMIPFEWSSKIAKSTCFRSSKLDGKSKEFSITNAIYEGDLWCRIEAHGFLKCWYLKMYLSRGHMDLYLLSWACIFNLNWKNIYIRNFRLFMFNVVLLINVSL